MLQVGLGWVGRSGSVLRGRCLLVRCCGVRLIVRVDEAKSEIWGGQKTPPRPNDGRVEAWRMECSIAKKVVRMECSEEKAIPVVCCNFSCLAWNGSRRCGVIRRSTNGCWAVATGASPTAGADVEEEGAIRKSRSVCV